MPPKDPQQRENPEKKETQPPPLNVKGGLERLREDIAKKPGVLGVIQGIWNSYNRLEESQKKNVATILGTAIFSLLLSDTKEKESDEQENEEADERTQEGLEMEEEDEEVEEEDEEVDEEDESTEQEETLSRREKAREVVCNDLRLICINTDPANNLRPKHLAGKSTYLLEYGLPNLETFKEEMMDILAPDEKDKEKAIKKAVNILKRSPMGMYQCMPQYLFGYVKKFKKYNLNWKEEGQEDEKMRAMWEFLQSEKLQEEAARGYLQSSARQYGGDPELVSASFYGGAKAANALKAYKEGTATPEQIHYLTKKQGVYLSILKYSGVDPAKPPKTASGFDMETQLARTATRESGNLRGKIAKPRDEKWESDQRFAYNQTARGNNDTPSS